MKPARGSAAGLETVKPWNRTRGRLLVFFRHPLRNLREYLLLRKVVRDPFGAVAMRVYSGKPCRAHLDLLDGRRICLRAGCSDRHIVWGNLLRDMYGLDDEPGPLGLVVDAGAHIGAFTVRIAPRADQVIAFEPAPENFELLRCNTAGVEYDHVEIHNSALAGDSGELPFYFSHRGGGSHGFFVPPEERRGKEIRVQTHTLPDFLEERGLSRVDILKLDCQGAEYEILDSLEQWGLNRIVRIVMEYHPFGSADPASALGEMKDRLSRAGFCLACRRRNKPGTGMIFATRKG